MKTFLTILLLQLLSIGLFGQVCLKGICLGEKGVDGKRVKQSVGGVMGQIGTFTLDDGRIFQIMFMPGDGEIMERVDQSALDNLLSGLENNFGVTLELTEDTSDDFDGRYDANFSKAGRNYAISVRVEKEELFNLGINLVLVIVDLDLLKIYEKEKLTDF